MTPPDDVVVVGGGPAGALAALLLARAGCRVRVFERARFPRAKLCGDTLNPGALARLGAHLDLAPLCTMGLPLAGMRLSGPGGATVEGRYPSGRTGLAVTRTHLDTWLLSAAAAAGATVEEGCRVDGPIVDGGQVRGVVVGGRPHRARLVVAADGRGSRLAQACGLVRTPAAPRRWALGVYASDVAGMDAAFGEMHVRAGGYLGLAPTVSGATNVCLVLGRAAATRAVQDPWAAIRAVALGDPRLAWRLAEARPLGRPVVLGPMALDATAAGVPGLAFEVQHGEVGEAFQRGEAGVGHRRASEVHGNYVLQLRHRHHVLVLDRRALQVKAHLDARIFLGDGPDAAAGFLDGGDRFGVRGAARRLGRVGRFGRGGHLGGRRGLCWGRLRRRFSFLCLPHHGVE